MSDLPSTDSSDLILTDSSTVPTKQPHPLDVLAGLRFSYLIKQHLDRTGDKHGDLERLARQIGCSASLLTKWRYPHKVRAGLEQRSGIKPSTIGLVRRGLGVSSDYFLVDAKDYPDHVVLADGSTRPAEQDEVDCFAPVFDLSKKRTEVDAAARKQLGDHEREIADLKGQVSRLVGTVDRLTGQLERMLNGRPVNR